MNQTVTRILFVLLFAGFSTVWLSSCGEEDVPFIVDEDELVRYLREVPEARELFRTSNLVRTDPYTVPFDNGTYRDSLLGRTRNYDVSLIKDNSSRYYYADYGSLGELREAVVIVTDSLHVQIAREYVDTTITDTTYRVLSRYAFFLKLGDDAKDYVGWVLWGYNGLGDALLPVAVEAERYDLSTFPGDLGRYLEMPKSPGTLIPSVPFMRLSNIDTVVLGSRLRLTTEKLSNKPATYVLLTDYADDGPFMSRLVQSTGPDFDTLSYKTESNTTRYYRMAFMQAFKEADGEFVAAWCVPYRF